MTDHSFPIVDAAPVCPFVAFEEDRDQRAENPDHRHRCYADERPSPRALAHQSAYCLSSSFPACPTFQDWARREAARPRPSAIADPYTGEAARRNPPAAWTTPPAWRSAAAPDQQGDAGAARSSSPDDSRASSPWTPGRRDEGLAASPAYRLASGHSDETAWRTDFDRVDEDDAGSSDDQTPRHASAGGAGYMGGAAAAGAAAAAAAARGVAASASTPGGAGVAGVAGSAGLPAGGAAYGGRPRPADPEASGPSWERPRRFEAYPTLKTRVGLPNVPRVALIAAGVVVAAIILFLLPGFFFGKPAGVASSPSPAASVQSSAAAVVTPVPAPSALTYTVAKNDTMSKIAAKFHVNLADLIAANKAKYPDPNKIAVGDVLVIPGALPSAVPNASSAP